ADGELLVGAADDVAVHPHALLELDDHRVVRRVLEEGGMLGAVDDDERVDLPASGEADPVAALRETARAENARRPAQVTAFPAPLHAQLALPAVLPVRGAVLG